MIQESTCFCLCWLGSIQKNILNIKVVVDVIEQRVRQPCFYDDSKYIVRGNPVINLTAVAFAPLLLRLFALDISTLHRPQHYFLYV